MEHTTAMPTIAPLVNVSLCLQALDMAMNRAPHLPGIVCFNGPSGFGKSSAAAFVANNLKAYYVECRSCWTKRAFLQAIMKDIGKPHDGMNLSDMIDEISEQLALSGRPLIIDETDHIVDKKAIELVRDIYEGSGAAILLIGEERLPQKLKKWERFHGRILDWVYAQPASLADARQLAKLYCQGIKVEDDLLARVSQVAHGSVRRICVNLERIRAEADMLGQPSIGLKQWGNKALFSGEAPVRRAL
jgi:DNA transposition AAA+ family ATPase